MWVESEVFGEIIVGNIFKGKLWNWVICVYKLSYEVLWRVLWFILMKWVKDKDDNECNIFVNLLEILVIKFMIVNNNDVLVDVLISSEFVNEVG